MKKMKTAKTLVAKVKSLGELRRLARTDDRYNRLLMVAAENLGWMVPTHESPTLTDHAYKWLEMNANETTERGVVAEVNACRDLI